MKLDVKTNTNPITPGAIAPKAFSFGSGGGGGGGGDTTNLIVTGVNPIGIQDAIPVVIPPAAGEVVVGQFNANFVGGKKALFVAWLTLSSVNPIQAKLRVYLNNALVTEVVNPMTSGSWGFLINATPAGVTDVKLTMEDLGVYAVNIDSKSVNIMEFNTL